MSRTLSIAIVLLFVALVCSGQNVAITGERKVWHRVSLTFDGPPTGEESTPNPSRDFRLNVSFTHPASGASFTAPGFYAADGNAAETSAKSGNKWRVHFAPDRTGEW